MEYEIQASSIDKAIQVIYDRLLVEFGEHKTFSVQLMNIEITTTCTTCFSYNFEVTDLN